MRDDRQGFDLEQLKRDPNMWMRLAMPSKNGDSLESVFKKKENPFEKNDLAAVETIQRLAAEGKLYLRERGRSRHFHKVETDGDNLKLGDQHEMKLSNRTTDPVLAGLMWLSRVYFKWIGLERISNWFDKRLQHRAEIIELDNRYKEEYKSLSKEEKKVLKALRKHEKNLKKLEKIQKEAVKTQQELDKIQGKDKTKTKEKVDPQPNQPVEVKPVENTTQPPQLNDKPVQMQTQQTPVTNLVQQNVVQQEITGTKREAPQNNIQIFIEGKELNAENAKDFPPHVVEAFKLIQQLIIEKGANENTNQQPVREQQPEVKENVPQQEQPPEVKENVPQPEQIVNNDQPVAETVKHEEKPPGTEAVKQEENLPVTEAVKREEKPPVAEEVKANMDAPLNDPPKVEGEKVSIQGRPKEQAKPTLQERLAAEKQAIDSAISWKDNVVNALFSHEENSTAKDYYEMLNKGSESAGAEFLVGAVFGILSNNSATPEQKQQVLDALLSGKPLGAENQELIDNGIAAYNDAFARKTSGNPERLADMLADSMRELSYQSGRETAVSPRFVMIGRLISGAAKMAKENDLELPLSEDDMILVRGAATLSDVSQKYYEARQFLGKEPMDISSKSGRRAVRDLLMGNAVDKMIQQDKRLGQTITNTQQIMGEGLWNLENLQVYTNTSPTRRGIKPEDVRTLLEKPKSTKALGIGISTVNEIVKASQEDYSAAEKALQKQTELEQQGKQFEINPANIPG